MDIMAINLYAEAYHSGAEYDETMIISMGLYEKIKNTIEKYNYELEDKAEGIYVGELDGKHSETYGYLDFTEYKEAELDTFVKPDEKKDHLYYKLREICNEYGLSLDDDLKKVRAFLDGVDSLEEITVNIRKSKLKAFYEFVDTL